MSKSRQIAAIFLAIFYIAGSILVGAAIGACCFLIFYATGIKFLYFGLYFLPAVGFLFGIYYALSVLKNDRT